MSFGIYLAGFLILIGGLIWGAMLLHVAPHWIAVGAIVLVGLAILKGVQPRGVKILRNKFEAGEEAIGLSSLEAGLGLERFAAESPDANHNFEFWETFPDLSAHRSCRRKRARRQGRDTGLFTGACFRGRNVANFYPSLAFPIEI